MIVSAEPSFLMALLLRSIEDTHSAHFQDDHQDQRSKANFCSFNACELGIFVQPDHPFFVQMRPEKMIITMGGSSLGLEYIFLVSKTMKISGRGRAKRATLSLITYRIVRLFSDISHRLCKILFGSMLWNICLPFWGHFFSNARNDQHMYFFLVSCLKFLCIV